MALVSAPVTIFFGWPALALGWGILLVLIVLLSIEPFTSAALALLGLLAGALIISPRSALGAAILLSAAGIFAAGLLLLRSWQNRGAIGDNQRQRR